MAFMEKRACLWHAFDALADKKEGTCIKSKLKVLTHNLATCLGLMKAEEEIDAYTSGNTMTFDVYTEFLTKFVFSKLEENDVVNSNTNLDKIDEVCWMLCSKAYLRQEDLLISNVLRTDDIYKLWRIFNFLAEPNSSGDVLCPVVVDIEEVALLVQRLCIVLGNITDVSQVEERTDMTVQCRFSDCLKVLSEYCCQDCKPDELSAAIQNVYDDLVINVIKKGYLMKKGHKMTNWKEKWFVLTTQKLSYYTCRDEVDLKGEWRLSPKCSVQVLMDKPGAKLNRFLFRNEGKDNELSASDMKSSTEWISALRNAIELNAKPMSPQKTAFQKRRFAREGRRERKREDAERRKEEQELAEKTRQLLIAEQQARAEAEARLEFEQKAKELEARRIRELEQIQKQLEALLEEERQAKRDEEIVRNLQSRILEEQFQKAEHLEELKAKMEQELQEERQKRENLEELKSQQEMLLTEEKEYMAQLEMERQANDERLEEALRKLQDAEKSKQKLQDKILEVTRERKRFGSNSGDSIVSHRGLGAFPSPQTRCNGSISRLDSKDKTPLGQLDSKFSFDHLGSDSEKENMSDNSFEK